MARSSGIVIAKNDRPNNFAVFRPRKSGIRLDLRLERSDELEGQLEEAGLDILDSERRGRRYRLRLTEPEIDSKRDLLSDLLKRAYHRSTA